MKNTSYVNDTVFNVYPTFKDTPKAKVFSRYLKDSVDQTPDALAYSIENDFEAETDWNQDPPEKRSLVHYACYLPHIRYAQTLETTYFGTLENVVTANKLTAFGQSFLSAIEKFIENFTISWQK